MNFDLRVKILRKLVRKYWQIKYWQMAVDSPNLPIFSLATYVIALYGMYLVMDTYSIQIFLLKAKIV